jgi:RNA polymerase sigma factor (sigma-70 family)
MLPSRELIAAARAGDAVAAEALFSSLYGPLDRYLSGRLPREVRALWETADFVQEVCVRAWSGIGSFDRDSPAAFWGYLRTIARNLAIDVCRVELRRRQELQSEAEHPSPADPNGKDIVEALARQELYERALASLEEPLRNALILRLELDASYEELAPELGVATAEAARKALRRALDEVARRMEADANN